MRHSPTERHYRWFDTIFMTLQQGLQACPSLAGKSSPSRPSPAEAMVNPLLSKEEKKSSGRLMRVNHSGEVCAQALYLGQSLTAQQMKLKIKFNEAANEEVDHLFWCHQRIKELHTHTSYLNPVWFIGSLIIGAGAGLMGDRLSLGFLAETERQVAAHLARHLNKLPEKDDKSRAILIQMQEEEQAHAVNAVTLGAKELSATTKKTMTFFSQIMTNLSYYV